MRTARNGFQIVFSAVFISQALADDGRSCTVSVAPDARMPSRVQAVFKTPGSAVTSCRDPQGVSFSELSPVVSDPVGVSRFTARRIDDSTAGADRDGRRHAGTEFVLLAEHGCPAATSDRPFDSVLADLHERTFRFFWETANPNNGLVPDRYPTPSFASIAAVGYALTAYPVGVEHAYITREAARERVLTTLRFLYAAPQGPQTRGTAGYKGFFYHFLDLNTGERFGNVELSPADTALFLAGALFCQSYFNRKNTEEVEIRALVNALYSRVDWRWMQPRAPAIVVGWKPESGFIADDYHGYSEVTIMYLLALGSPSFAVGPEAWGEWTSTYERTWGHYFGQTYLHFPPLFGHQFTHVWVDFRNIQDDYMRAHGIDYFENSRRATYAQRAYAIDNPLGCKDYGESVWGITASDGPANVTVQQRVYRSYAARGIGGASAYDDCTLAPTAVAGSIPFAPEITIPTLLQMHRRYGQRIYSRYGFLDSFNPSFDYDLPLRHGRRIPGFGWVDNDYLGVDQGPILAMLENYHTELIWRVMRKNPYLRRGLERAGFSGGWLADAQRDKQ